MKNLLRLTITTCTVLSLSACSSKGIPNPSQNNALNSVTKSNAKKHTDGAMQSSLDSWLKDEWRPAIEKDETIKEIEQNKSRDFTLQEYVDKAEIYQKNKKPSNVESHVKKINSMPVIGK